MVGKIYFCVILFALVASDSLRAEYNFSNYKQYSLTKTTFKLERVADNLQHPWGMSFIDDEHILITEKNGALLKIDINSGEKTLIAHDIQSIRFNGGSGSEQGGLLDVYFHDIDNYLYFTYSHDFKKSVSQTQKMQHSSSAIARGKLVGNEIIDLEVLLIATPSQKGKKHYGSRIIIKSDMLYAGFGERGLGMIAQDPRKHPGSIVRIKTNGDIPEDNPSSVTSSNWLPELYQIGIRNSQGMALSPHNQEVYFSNHGPRGGDSIGIVKYAGNYGWKNIAWGGAEYSGFRIGDVPFSTEFDMPVKTWVPSIGIGSIQFYQGEVFPEWNGDLLVSALSGKCLIRLDFEGNAIVGEEIIFKNKIGRIRDFEVDNRGNIFLISDDSSSSLWKLSEKNARF